jgi:hypothetical protein
MNESFPDRLDAKLQESQKRLNQRQSEMARYMSGLEQRQEEFNCLGTWLIRELVRPRVELVARRPENASGDVNQPLPTMAFEGLRAEHNEDTWRLYLAFHA